MRPSVCRLVHYVDPYSGAHIAAIITTVENGKAWLMLFRPNGAVENPTHNPVEQDEAGCAKGTWHTPERVEER